MSFFPLGFHSSHLTGVLTDFRVFLTCFTGISDHFARISARSAHFKCGGDTHCIPYKQMFGKDIMS